MLKLRSKNLMQLILARLSQIGWVKTMITEKRHNNAHARRPPEVDWVVAKVICGG